MLGTDITVVFPCSASLSVAAATIPSSFVVLHRGRDDQMRGTAAAVAASFFFFPRDCHISGDEWEQLVGCWQLVGRSIAPCLRVQQSAAQRHLRTTAVPTMGVYLCAKGEEDASTRSTRLHVSR